MSNKKSPITKALLPTIPNGIPIIYRDPIQVMVKVSDTTEYAVMYLGQEPQIAQDDYLRPAFIGSNGEITFADGVSLFQVNQVA
jgi:hypothetical protein